MSTARGGGGEYIMETFARNDIIQGGPLWYPDGRDHIKHL